MTETPKIDDGGPAFPHTRVHADTSGRINDGMTLRDYFAGQVLSALVLDAVEMGRDIPTDLISNNAYALADAMLAARSNPQGEQE